MDKLNVTYTAVSARIAFFYFQVIEEADIDGDGALNFQEFERVMTLNAAPDFLE